MGTRWGTGPFEPPPGDRGTRRTSAHDDRRPRGLFYEDLEADLKDPRFRRAYRVHTLRLRLWSCIHTIRKAARGW